MHISPEGLLKCSDAELQQAANDREGLQDLFESIWEKVRPLYAGQPKSLQSAEGLSLAHLALRLAAHGTVLRTEPQPDGTWGVAVEFGRRRVL